MDLILASASPRRRELLESLGVNYRVETGPPLDEAALLSAARGTWPERLVLLARAKGQSMADRLPAALVLSADTEVILDGTCLGKPPDAQAARAMLTRLAGRSHTVCTALALRCRDAGLDLTGTAETEVKFAAVTSEQIDTYVERAQPFDFAGGYAIQGLGALLIEGINGDYSNVVGLPLRLAAQLLSQAGFRVL